MQVITQIGLPYQAWGISDPRLSALNVIIKQTKLTSLVPFKTGKLSLLKYIV